MALLLLLLALGAVVSHSNGHPLQHGSSSYMYQYQQHSPAVPVHVPVAHNYQPVDSSPLVLRAGYLAEPHHILSVQHEGFLPDTHEVTSTDNAHLEAVVAHSFHGQEHSGHSEHHHEVAVPVVLPSGYLADTQEVADAKAHHLSAVSQAKADKYYGGHADAAYGGAYGYSGSVHGYGVPVVLPNGHIADTHEVAAAKSAHLVAVAKAKAEKYYEGGEGYGYGGAYGYSGSVHGYGVPVVLPNGHIADTHEVAAAKSAHMVAVAHAKAQEALSGHDEDEHEGPHYESHYEREEPHYESQYEHEEPHYASLPHHQPEYESHDVSQIAYYEPHQELEYESYAEPHNSYGYH